MNKAILIVICDFLVSAMLTMMTGMVPGHSGGTGVGLDERTTRVLLEELTRNQLELETLRLRLRRAFERAGVETLTPEQEAELRRIADELAANLARQEQLRTRIGAAMPEDQTEAIELRIRLEEAEAERKQLEERLRAASEALAGQQQELEDVSSRLRDQERQSAVLSRDMSRTRQALADASRDLAATKDALLAETREHGRTREELAASETGRRAAEQRATQAESRETQSNERASQAEQRATQAERREADTRAELAASEASRRAAEERASQAESREAQSNERASRAEERASQAERREADTRAELAASEASRRAAEERATQTREELSAARRDLGQAQEQLVTETRDHGRTRAELAASETGRESAEARAFSAEARATRSENRAAQSEERAAQAERREADTRTALAASETGRREAEEGRRQAQEGRRAAEEGNTRLRSDLESERTSHARTSGRLESSEVSNAELRDHVERLQRQLLVERLKRQDAETQRDMMQETTDAAVRELSEERRARAESERENARLQGELSAGGGSGNAPAAPSQNRVFECYAGALVRITSVVSEKKLLGERTGETVSFYPVVDFGNGRILIVGALNRFAGDWEYALKFEDVTKVQMSFSAPFGSSGASPRLISGRMLVSGQMFHLAAFEYTDNLAQPLRVLDAAALQQRGVEDLFVFKCGSMESNTRLTGRVSLVMDADNPALFIRNVGRGALKLEQGDIIMSLQGEFVGIVSDEVKVDGSDGALVPLIRNVGQLWEEPIAIPLGKDSREQFYSGYAQGMRDLRQHIRGGYDRGRN